MWCYQKPGFEALVLAELQRQQQCSQLCDTLLKTEDILVPAHSCILSAVSPHISSALSSMPTPPAGQSRLLEFRALGTCTLLHMVRLLYCGEMAGEGEEAKQEAISAAARLGINGLVEVTKGGRKSRNKEGEGWQVEVGVQTELPMSVENGGRLGRWRREVKDGITFMWKETQSHGKKDTWTQTEELQVQTGLPSHPAASFDTIDMDTLQNLGQTNSHLVPPEIPYIPVSLIYPSDELNQTHQPSSALVDSMQESAVHTSNSADAPLCAADFQSGCPVFQEAARGAAAEEWEDESLEQFQGNIPGYISYFLNPDKKEGAEKIGRGRVRGRRRTGVGGARRAGTGERGTRRPRARTAGRGRGGLTQTVDVQEVGLSRLQKLFVQRWRPSRTGQGGGAVGRKLHLKTRALLKTAKSCQRRRGCGKEWEFSEYSEGRINTQQGRRRATQQIQQVGLPVGRAQRARATPAPSVSFSSPPMPFYSVQASTFRPSPSPAASYVPPASSVLPPPPPPPHEEQPEHFDRLLEEVMMGLDILPNKNSSAPHSQPPASTSSSSSCAYTNKQPGCTTDFLQAQPGCRGSTQVFTVARGAGSSSGEAPFLLQGEGELNEMLDHFLQSFEQHIDRCAAREEVELGDHGCTEASQPYAALSKSRNTPFLQNTHMPSPATSSQITKQSNEAETQQRCSQPCKASAHSTAHPKHTEGSEGNARAPPKQRRRKNNYLFSLEKKRVKVRKPTPTSDSNTKTIHDRRNKQLQQMPVVKLRRSGPLPTTVTLQEASCLEVKSTAKAKTRSSSVKCPHDSWNKKTYPIRSRFRQAQIMDSMPFLEDPLHVKRPLSAGRTSGSCGRTSKNGQLLSLSNGQSSTPPIQPQLMEPCGEDEQQERDEERCEKELMLQPQEGAMRRREKRGAELETSEESTVVAKRARFEPSSQSADSEPATKEVNVVLQVRDCLQGKCRDDKTTQSEIKLRETEESLMAEETESSDQIIHGDANSEDDCHRSRTSSQQESGFIKVKSAVSPSSHLAKEVSLEVRLGSTGSQEEEDDEDIDVVASSSPVPEPVVISWTDSSEGEEDEEDEDIDVVGEKTNYASSAVLAIVSTGELVNTKYKTEVLLL